MVSKRKLATATAASFGAALSTIYTAPELQADIVGLTFTPGSVATSGTASVIIDQVGAGFDAWNDYNGVQLLGLLNANPLNGGITTVSLSQSLSAGFMGNPTVIYPTGTGTVYIGFGHNGNAGWFSVDLGPGPMVFLGGEYGSMGETVHVGGTVIPEPTGLAGLALLALGAAGVRRNRKK